ncbi:helix-turn-helix domain-containing protein [Kitasatospora sp. NPDC093679]|uniref:helix-turn-helix domain-containing protein n=1 Tax=Kitasatospora sp. NPDC093679 TaxID=3154983 RepID=UPI003434CDEA
MRAHIVLHTARGCSNARIARETGLHVDTVRTWRRRFAEQGVPGLADRRRPGRPPSFPALQSARSRRWPANCPPRPVLRYPAGCARNWPARWSPGLSPRPWRPPLCAAGSRPTRSSPGSTRPGSSSATRTSRPRPPACRAQAVIQ